MSAEAPVGAVAAPGFLHCGFRCSSRADVDGLWERVTAAGVHVVERTEEPDFVSFKCLDPDGYVVEAYWAA